MAGSKRPKRANRRTESPSTARLEDKPIDGAPPQPSPANGFPALPATLLRSYSPEIIDTICDSVAVGISISHTLRITRMRGTYDNWRKNDDLRKYIDGRIAEAESQFIKRNIDRIDKAADKYWQAAAWLLERRYPSQFSAGVARGKGGTGGTGGPVTVVVVNSAVPRPYDVLRYRGKVVGEPGTPPDEIETMNAEVLKIVSNVPRRKKEEEDEGVTDDDA